MFADLDQLSHRQFDDTFQLDPDLHPTKESLDHHHCSRQFLIPAVELAKLSLLVDRKQQ
jgi:hypothetical protein